MKETKYNSKVIKLFGYVAFSIGLLAFLEEHVFKLSNYSHSYDPAYGLAVCALILLGMTSVVIAECIKNIEQRLDKLESNKSEN